MGAKNNFMGNSESIIPSRKGLKAIHGGMGGHP